MKKSSTKNAKDWIPILSLIVSSIALVTSIFTGWFNYQHSNKAVQLSEKALLSQGPNVAIAEEEIRKQSATEYSYNLPLKNVGQRTATNMKINFCFFGIGQNTLVAFHGLQEPANDLAPSVMRYASGSLSINPERHFPEVQFVVLNLSYDDGLLNETHSRNWFYGPNAFRRNEFTEISDANLKNQIEEFLPTCKRQ